MRRAQYGIRQPQTFSDGINQREDHPMYPHESSYRRTPDDVTSRLLNTITALGPYAASYLAAEERHLEAQQYATQWAATHPAREPAPRAWRQWSGKLLVRVGHRLEGVASTIEAEIQPATH
jgi:hypothetical protein